jgi:hypothetical protein
MRDTPQISVVMGVRNGAADLTETMQSVLAQEGPSLELVVVDDGSDDATPSMLAGAAGRDSRVRIIRQNKLGLTRALITGCAAARAPVIARQDCGDVSLPGRLAQQYAQFAATPGAALVSSGTEFIGPRGEWLYAVADTDATLLAGLDDLDRPRGPSHHGACMFPAALYRAAGGYRAAFPVAQDLDLWLRLAERGPAVAAPGVLYRARLSPGGISATRRAEQQAFTRLIVEGARARRAGRPDLSAEVAARLGQQTNRPGRGAFAYFLGRVLEAREPQLARGYFKQALVERPLFPRAWIALARTWLMSQA